MATKKKSKPAAKKKPAKTVAKKKPAAPKNKPRPTRAAEAETSSASDDGDEDGADENDTGASSSSGPKLKPLTLKQRLALIPRDPVTGKCPHGLMPETCSFCMGI